MFSKGLNTKLPAEGGTSFQSQLLLLIYFFIISSLSHIFGQRILAFLLLSAPFILLKTDLSTILAWCFVNLIAFYEPQLTTSNFYFFLIPDSLLFLFAFFSLLKRKNLFVIRFSHSFMIWTLYAFLLFFLIASIKPISQMGIDFFLLKDIRDMLLFGFAGFLIWHPSFSLKKSYSLLLVIVSSTTLLSCKFIYQYVISKYRIISWNEIYVADAILLSMLLLSVFKKMSIRILLIISIVINSISLLFIQTRSLWISVVFCTGVLFLFKFRSRLSKINFKKVLRNILNTGILSGVVIICLNLFLNIDALDYINKRFFSFKKNELIDPTSSLGYRAYESYMVWRERTILGHGPGARLHIVSTQMSDHKWHYWWSIHSEYFELLHKYGFLGLLLFSMFWVSFFYKSYKITTSKNNYIKHIGITCFIILLNHIIVSITSGYITRDNVSPFLLVLIVLCQRYGFCIRRNVHG